MTAAQPRRLVLLGHPVAHSLSPLFQNAALRAAQLDVRYEALDVTPADLPAAVESLRRDGGAGNVTIPHKVHVAALCGRLTPTAQRVGAVNTVWVDDGVLVGDNTDVVGFEAMGDSLGVERDGARVACIGAGGSAAAIIVAVSTWPAVRVTLWSRSAQRSLPGAAAAAPRASHAVDPASDSSQTVHVAESLDAAVRECTVVVNATPVGLHDDAMPVPLALLPRDARVMDLVYRPGATAWVRGARAIGLRAADGREMLLMQGAASFERWFGHPPDLRVMRQALEDALRPAP